MGVRSLYQLDVVIGTAYSSAVEVLQGMPQGSVLDPFLFVLFVNDLRHAFSNRDLYQFDDDTTIIITGRNDKDTSCTEFGCVNRTIY